MEGDPERCAAVVLCEKCDADAAREPRPSSAVVRVRALSPAPAAKASRIFMEGFNGGTAEPALSLHASPSPPEY